MTEDRIVPATTATATVPGTLDAAGVDARIARRRRVRQWWRRDAAEPGAAWGDAEPPPVGLALSGGGIRSATFSLGLIQALARSPRDALGRIDILSTVSGGGYAGCFLRSLFVPATLRGIAKPAYDPDLRARIADQHNLARHILASAPSAQTIAWPQGPASNGLPMRNPMWWLREHSRYLAPTGPTDFTFAIAYIARNWLAMIYLVALACIATGTLLVGTEALLLKVTGVPWTVGIAGFAVSPVILFAAVLALVPAALMIAYWTTQAMSTNEAQATVQFRRLREAGGWIVLAAIGAAIFVAAVTAAVLVLPGRTPHPAPHWPAVLGTRAVIGLGMGIALCVAGVAVALREAHRLVEAGALLTTELRRTLTARLARFNTIIGILVAVAVLDSAGASLAAWIPRIGPGKASGVAVLPALAFVIKKLPDWFGGMGHKDAAGGGIGSIVRRFARTLALVVGILLYSAVAIAALALVHRTIWPQGSWAADPDWARWTVLTGVSMLLALLLGQSTGFINLSSLHALYAARLTRAYLGGSNIGRMQDVHDTSIRESHACDYIQPRIYGGTDLPAPLHVISITLNQTIDPDSQIVSRDRKGDILTVEPDGVRVGTEPRTVWARLVDPRKPPRRRAENISLGQWIAISGAAASSGMGRMTSLGFALAFTFANVRLGYWWWSPRLCPKAPVAKGIRKYAADTFGTFVYLFNEMTCRYSRGYYRKYLTDGGHYENSGAYVLIRRRVPLILVTDNGADPDYAFADLETLVRQVRIDLGAETTILGGGALDAALARFEATDRSIFVDPETTPEWRARMTDSQAPAYVLVLAVKVGGETLDMLWLKPRLLPDVPADLVGYQRAMPSFPQQPTGDQFFDEAQWESYRKLGEVSMSRLLETCPKLLA